MRKKMLFLILILILMPINKVYGYTFGVYDAYTGEDIDTSTSNEPTIGNEFTIGKEDGWNYSCHYGYYINVTNDVTINIYDNKGNVINNNTIIPKNKKFTAGTAINLDIFETKNITYSISLDTNYTYIVAGRYLHTCYYRTNQYCVVKDEDGNCLWKDRSYNTRYEQTSCDNSYYNRSNGMTYYLYYDYKYWYADYTDRSQGDNKTVTCKEKALEKVKSEAEKYRSASYKAIYNDSNDIDGRNKTNVDFSTANLNSYCNTTTSSNGGVIKCKFNYNLSRACMNVLTAQVRYTNNYCGDEEIEVKPYGNAKTTYFIPLNTKTTDNFSLNMSTGSSWKTAKQCAYVINNNENWRQLIVKNSVGDTFTEEDYPTKRRALNYTNANGCYLMTTLNFPIEQKFYNEEEENDKTVFVGFNFYYKPIDITNPFPNGIASDSLWKGLWNNKTNKVTTSKNTTVNLYNSFTNTTYVATNLKLNEIRNYGNETNQLYYTSWSDMYTSGRSQFVDKYVTRTSYASYYALGCGPANASWEECKK